MTFSCLFQTVAEVFETALQGTEIIYHALFKRCFVSSLQRYSQLSNTTVWSVQALFHFAAKIEQLVFHLQEFIKLKLWKNTRASSASGWKVMASEK